MLIKLFLYIVLILNIKKNKIEIFFVSKKMYFFIHFLYSKNIQFVEYMQFKENIATEGNSFTLHKMFLANVINFSNLFVLLQTNI